MIALRTIITPLLDKMGLKSASFNNIEENNYTKLEQLKKLLDSNAISQDEYETEKNKILNK